MPNGKTHDIITFIILPVICIGTYLHSNIIITLIISSSYLFSSLMFNGDLDTNSRPYNRWWIFKMIWIPYQIIFYHRSVFTHGIIIGTLIRIIYVMIIPVIIIYFSFGYEIISNFINTYHWELIYILIGLEAGSSVHTISDTIF